MAEGDNPADVQGCMSAIQWNEPAFDGNAAFKSFSNLLLTQFVVYLQDSRRASVGRRGIAAAVAARCSVPKYNRTRVIHKVKKAAMLDGEGDGSVSPGEHGAACHQAGADTEVETMLSPRQR